MISVEKPADVKVGDIRGLPSRRRNGGLRGYIKQGGSSDHSGHHQSLLVTSGAKIVGILRLVDVFDEITKRIKLCKNQ